MQMQMMLALSVWRACILARSVTSQQAPAADSSRPLPLLAQLHRAWAWLSLTGLVQPSTNTSPSMPPTTVGVTTRLQHGIQNPKQNTDGNIACPTVRLTILLALNHEIIEKLWIVHTSTTPWRMNFLLSNWTWWLVPPVPRVNIIDSK
jgi:hypothetical protein